MSETAEHASAVEVVARRDAAVLWLQMNRPRVGNALNRPLGLALLQELQRAAGDETVRAVVLTGSGRAFCAGDDLAGSVAALSGDYLTENYGGDPHDGSALYLKVGLAMAECPKPVIAAVNGAAVGAGLELMCAADVRCMTRSARVGSGLIKVGHAGTWAFLPLVIGEAAAFELYLSGQLVDAETALVLRLATHVFDDEDFEESVAVLANQLAQLPTHAVGAQKHLREAMRGRPLAERAHLQDEIHRYCTERVADAREGTTAFVEKRVPRFTGR